MDNINTNDVINHLLQRIAELEYQIAILKSNNKNNNKGANVDEN